MTSRRLLNPATRVLLDAANYIEQHGWCQGSMYRKGRTCLVGAIQQVAQTVDLQFFACERLRLHLGMSDDAYWSLPAWNDRRGRKKAEVLAALRGAALQ